MGQHSIPFLGATNATLNNEVGHLSAIEGPLMEALGAAIAGSRASRYDPSQRFWGARGRVPGPLLARCQPAQTTGCNKPGPVWPPTFRTPDGRLARSVCEGFGLDKSSKYKQLHATTSTYKHLQACLVWTQQAFIVNVQLLLVGGDS